MMISLPPPPLLLQLVGHIELSRSQINNDLLYPPVQKEGGTQLKLILTMENKAEALVKPMR